MRLAGGLAAIAFVASACGGIGQASSSSVIPAPAADAGPALDAGGGADGGLPDAGPPDAGPAPDAGGPLAECEGLLPSDAGPGFILDLDRGDPSQACSAARTDEGSGTLPLRVATYDAAGLHQTTWSFYRASDKALLSRREWTSGEGPVSLMTQPQGFTGVELVGESQEIELRTLSHAGQDVSSLRTLATGAEGTVAPVPAGGTVVFTVDHAGAGYSLRFERYDAAGTLVADAVAATGDTVGATQRVATVAAVSANGDTLVVFGPSDRPCRAIWLDPKGQKASAYFAPETCRLHQLVPLLDGSVAVESYSLDASPVVAGVIPARGTEIADAPAWLAGLDLRELFTLPGGRGYALRRQGPAHPLEVVSPSGRKCGELTLPGLDQGPFSIGRDGTLIEQDYTGAGCTFRWYPQLFR
jgi:hypothetical protein